MKALKGTYDLLPGEVEKWQYLEDRLRRIFRLYGYSEIRTPIIEELALFKRSVGESTDIVQKEMYSFSDRGEREICLRPEATASVVRAYLEANLAAKEKLSRLFYFGPMFRAEKPQKGRNRQFHQAGVEVIGAKSEFLDAEVIGLLADVLTGLGIVKHRIKLNSLGCRDDREKYCRELRAAVEQRRDRFCEDCRRRADANVLRILDCKNGECRREMEKLPVIGESICPGCRDYRDKVLRLLDAGGIRYELDPLLVRGLDYYTSVVFEVTSPDLGAQDALGAGGRYDNLVEELGGTAAGAAGFALGLERLILAMDERGVWNDPISGFERFRKDAGLDVFLVKAGTGGGEIVSKLLSEARAAGIAIQTDFDPQSSFKAQMRQANKLGVKLVGILGEDEIREDTISLKNMASGEQRKIPRREFAAAINKELSSPTC